VVDWFSPANDLFKLWTDQQKSMFQAWADQAGAAPSSSSPDAVASAGVPQMSELMKHSMEAWAALAQQGWPMGAGGAIDAAGMQKLFDPAEWQRAGQARFDLALERLTGGPAFAQQSNLDRKLASARKLWLERARDIEAVRSIVQAAWNRTFGRFMNALNDASAPPLKTGRDVLELWLETANVSLLEMHRSEEFLEAQRRMTRSATEYQLQEREIAEAYCAMHHIPTRTEMDEVQRGMWELKRELRVLRNPTSVAPKAARTKPKPRSAAAPRAKKGARR
jgi:hypothetical protein